MTRSGPLLRVKDSRAELAVGGRGAAALVQPADEIAFEDASPARREFNDRRSFAECDQTLQRTASEAGDRGGLIVGVDGERGLPAPHRGVTAFVPGQACRASRQDAHPPVGMRNDAHTQFFGSRSNSSATGASDSNARVAQATLLLGYLRRRPAARRIVPATRNSCHPCPLRNRPFTIFVRKLRRYPSGSLINCASRIVDRNCSRVKAAGSLAALNRRPRELGCVRSATREASSPLPLSLAAALRTACPSPETTGQRADKSWLLAPSGPPEYANVSNPFETTGRRNADLPRPVRPEAGRTRIE